MLDTPRGPASAHVHRSAGEPSGARVLGYGAGGGVGAPDLVVATEVATSRGLTVPPSSSPAGS